MPNHRPPRVKRAAGGYRELGRTWRDHHGIAFCGDCDGRGVVTPATCGCTASPSFVGVHWCAPVPCSYCDGSGVVR